MMFAQINTPAPDPNHMLQFWLIISLISACLASISTFVSIIANRKQRREVSFVHNAPTKEEFDQHVAENRLEHANIRAELKADRHDNQVHASTRAAGIYKKVDEVRQELERKVESLRSDVNQTPDRTVALLRNTGVIE